MVVGLSAVDIAVLALAATIVVVATVIRAALAAAADVDAPGSRALSAATRLASGAVLAALAGAAVVTAITFGARLLGVVAEAHQRLPLLTDLVAQRGHARDERAVAQRLAEVLVDWGLEVTVMDAGKVALESHTQELTKHIRDFTSAAA